MAQRFRARHQTLVLTSASMLVFGGAYRTEPKVRLDDRTSSCAAGEWTPVWSRPLPPGTFFRSPSLAIGRRANYVAGVPAPIRQASRGVEAGTLSPTILSPDAALNFPTSDPHRPLNVRVLPGRGGLLHVVWGEPDAGSADSTSRPGMPAIRVSSLWHATYAAGSGWSRPAMIAERAGPRGRLLWNSENADVSVSSSGGIHLVVPQIGGELLHFTWTGARWHEERLPILARYAAVAESRTGAMYVAAVGRSTASPTATDAMLFLASPSDGSPWTAPQTVGTGIQHTLSRPRLFVGKEGDVHLLFGLSATGGRATTLRHRGSSDGGRHWSDRADLELPQQPFTKWHAGLDGCGTVHAVASTWLRRDSGQVGALSLAALTDSGWTSLSPVLENRGAREVEVVSDESGNVYLVASVEQSGRANDVSFALAVFRWTAKADHSR